MLGQTSGQLLTPLSSIGIYKPEIVGFLPYWLLDKADKNYGKYITTLTYFGLAVEADGSVMKLINPREQEPGWTALGGEKVTAKIAQAKKQGVKSSLLIICGDDAIISEMISDPVASANNLLTDVIPIMKERGFTDLNLDIESFIEASASSRQNFTTYVRTVKDGLMAANVGTLTIDLIPIAMVKEKLYDPRALGAIADKVVLMTYDYHYLGGLTSGAVAPIGGAGETLEYDVETAAKEALKVIPREKILLGIPLYGYQWETISDVPEAATIIGGGSTASVRRVVEIIRDCANCVLVRDPVAQAPYVIYPDGDFFQQIYFEDETSMKMKIAIAEKYKLAGVALWALGYEDEAILNPLGKYKQSLILP